MTDALEHPTSVLLQRIALNDGVYWQDAKYGDFKVVSTKAITDAATLDRFAKTLANPRTDSRLAKTCVPDYQYRVVFQGTKCELAFDFCAECTVLVMYKDGNMADGWGYDNVQREIDALILGGD